MTSIYLFYIIYIGSCIVLTAVAARILYRCGLTYLGELFTGNEAPARAVNYLLVASFLLINAGFVASNLRSYEQLADIQTALSSLVGKLGGVALMLGTVLMISLFILSKIGRQTLKSP